MGFLFFLLAFLLWEAVSLLVISGSLTNLFGNFADQRLILSAVLFNGFYALPIAGYIALAYAVSHRAQPRMRLLAFLGLSGLGAGLLLLFFYVNLSNWQLDKENGFTGFIVIPTACVLALYLVRFAQSMARSAPG
jgi:hypothetical protein